MPCQRVRMHQWVQRGAHVWLQRLSDEVLLCMCWKPQLSLKDRFPYLHITRQMGNTEQRRHTFPRLPGDSSQQTWSYKLLSPCAHAVLPCSRLRGPGEAWVSEERLSLAMCKRQRRWHSSGSSWAVVPVKGLANKQTKTCLLSHRTKDLVLICLGFLQSGN